MKISIMMPFPPPPQISFILPVYNVEPYLAECLDSILKHNISKEIIIIDDGSQDRSFEIAQDYFLKHPEIVLYRQHNRGVSAARNAGLRLARGKWLNFTDPDDFIIEPNIAQMLELAEQHDIDVFKGMVQRSFEDGSSDIIIRPPEYEGLPENAFALMKGYEHLHMMLARDWFANANFGFYKTAFLRQHGIQFREGISMSEDGLWILDVLTATPHVKVMEMGRLWYNYRIRANSALTSKDNLRGVVSAIQAANLMREKAENIRQQFAHATPENQAILQQIYVDILRAAAVTYGICYRYVYLPCSDEGKAQVRHHFTPEILTFMGQFLSYPIVL